MHAVDYSSVDRKRKKKKRKHEDIIRQNSFTNDNDFVLVNNYVINKDSGDITEIKKHKKKRKNLDEAFLAQNGIDTEVGKRNGKRSHSGELITDSVLLLNNIKVEGGLKLEHVSKKHHFTDTPHHFDVDQKYIQHNDFGSKADNNITKKKKFKHCSREDERATVVKKKKKKRNKKVDTIPIETQNESEFVHCVPPQTDKHNNTLVLHPGTSWESFSTNHCNINDDVRRKKKKKRHKDDIANQTQKQHKEIRYSLLNESCDNNEVGTKKRKKKKRHKDITGSAVVQAPALVEHCATESNVRDKPCTMQLCNVNGETEKKPKKKKPHKDLDTIPIETWGEPEFGHYVPSQTDKHNKDGGWSTNFFPDTSWQGVSTKDCNVNEGVMKKKAHKNDSIENETEKQQEEVGLLNESCDNEVGTKKRKKKRHKGTIEAVVQLSSPESTQLCNANGETEKKRKKKKHHKDITTDESETGHQRIFSPSNETQHFNASREIERKKTQKKYQEEHTIKRVKTERNDEIENQINLAHFVLNETPQHIVSEKPAEPEKIGVDTEGDNVTKEIEDNHAHALPQLESDENIIGVDDVDRTEKEKADSEQSNTTDTGFDDCSITSTDHGAKDDHNQNEGEESHRSFCENTSTIERFNADNQMKNQTTVLNSNFERHVEGEDDVDDESEIEAPSNKVLKGVDFVKHYLDKASVRTKLTEDDKQLLEQLHVIIPFDIPQSHLIETRMSSHPTKKQKDRFKELGLKMNITHYNQAEDNIIKNNWKHFCKVHDLPNDPSPFMSFEACNDTKMKGSILSKPERIKFVQFLGQKLDTRYLYSIYRRFKKLFATVKKGRFSKTEDDLIWEYIKQSDDSNQFSKLACVLKRDRHRILMRYKLLQAQRERRRGEK